MSQWTHVAGTIRIDCLFHEGVAEQIKNVLGRTWEYDDDVDPDIEYAPYGSEGSIQYIITENLNESCMAAFVVTFYGDLRDYTDDAEIIAWFEKACNALHIRQAVITIEVGTYKSIYGSYIGRLDNTFSYHEILH